MHFIKTFQLFDFLDTIVSLLVAFVFATLIFILLVMPNGLLGRSTEDRA